VKAALALAMAAVASVDPKGDAAQPLPGRGRKSRSRTVVNRKPSGESKLARRIRRKGAR
jgi:hypothetical protein